MTNPYSNITTRATPQNQPVFGRDMIANAAGGYVFKVSDETRLERFLILGTAGGTYYIGENKLTADAAKDLIAFCERDPAKFLSIVRDVSVNGRAYKQQPTLFALAIACSFGTTETKALALRSVNDICRTGTMFFNFQGYLEQFRGRGRAVKTMTRNWYLDRSLGSLQNQLVKYQSRDGWSHRDMIRLAQLRQGTDEQRRAIRWASDLETDLTGLDFISAFEAAKAATTVDEVIAAIQSVQLPWEAVPSQWLREPKVWEAMLPHLGLTALFRNLGRLSNIGLVTHNSAAAKLVSERLVDAQQLADQRLHPMQALLALVTYNAGRGVKGDLEWTPVPRVSDAIEEAFYMSFGNVPSTNKRRFLALDTSGSMSSRFGGTFLRSCEATAAMAMIAVRSEANDVYVKHFSNEGSRRGWGAPATAALGDLGFTSRTTLTQATKKALAENWGGTDCALPMTWALKNNIEVDTFEIYTDNDTWAGNIHPFQALKQYRQKTGIDAKLVVVSTMATNVSIADPSDPGMLDCCGFDASTPSAISYFITS